MVYVPLTQFVQLHDYFDVDFSQCNKLLNELGIYRQHCCCTSVFLDEVNALWHSQNKTELQSIGCYVVVVPSFSQNNWHWMSASISKHSCNTKHNKITLIELQSSEMKCSEWFSSVSLRHFNWMHNMLRLNEQQLDCASGSPSSSSSCLQWSDF